MLRERVAQLPEADVNLKVAKDMIEGEVTIEPEAALDAPLSPEILTTILGLTLTRAPFGRRIA